MVKNWAGHSRANCIVLSVRLADALLFVTIFVFASFKTVYLFLGVLLLWLAPGNCLSPLSILSPSFKLKNLPCNFFKFYYFFMYLFSNASLYVSLHAFLGLFTWHCLNSRKLKCVCVWTCLTLHNPSSFFHSPPLFVCLQIFGSTHIPVHVIEHSLHSPQYSNSFIYTRPSA